MSSPTNPPYSARRLPFAVALALTLAVFGLAAAAEDRSEESTSPMLQTFGAGLPEQEEEPSSSPLQTLLAPPAEPLRAAVSIAPIAYLVERIAGERVKVQVLVPAGQSHHTYDPTPRQMADLSGADVNFRIGMPFEESLLRKVLATKEGFRSVNIARDVPFVAMSDAQGDKTHEREEAHEAGEEEHGRAHRAGEPDPHVWLDPGRAEIMARAICAALSEIQPGGGPYFEYNLKTFLDELSETDAQVAAILAPFRGRTIYVYHPSYGYFVSAYGLKQAAVETEGKEPGARGLARLIERAKAERVRAIYVQREFSSKTPSAIAEAVGAKVVTLDPLARDYLANLVRMAQAIREGFSSDAAK